jgi:CO/xanthine dehydrogenase FAD-binding subunit
MFNGQAIDNEIQAAKRHMAEIRNGAYFNARVAELADVFKPQCANQLERDLLKTKLWNSVNREMPDQATDAMQHIARVLLSNEYKIQTFERASLF